MYFTILDIANWTLIALMGLSLLLLLHKIFFHIYGLFPAKQFPDAKIQHKFAILVPARDEHKVIKSLLDSFDKCDYPKEMFDVFVIVENKDDPTVEICKNYSNVISFVRPNLKIKTKGGALDQVFKHIIDSGIAKDKGYEAYFIFDADNVVAPNYLTEMNKSFDAGYEFALGYRNARNWNDGWIASCSALTFSILNTFQNKCRARFTENVLVSGTGFYISARIINDLGGWPFQSLTEDVEISHYAVLHGIKATYNEYAEFFDEQPASLKTSWNQRLRWVKGFGQVHKKYDKQLRKSAFITKENVFCKLEFSANIIPIAVPLAVIIVYALFTLVMGFVGLGMGVPAYQWEMAFTNCYCSVIGIYTFFVAYTLAMLIAERKHINISAKNAFVTCIMNPFFMAQYIPIVITAIFKKDITWKRIEHTKTN